MKKLRIFYIFFIILMIVMIDLFRYRKLSFLEESEIYTSKIVQGKAWLIITNKKQADIVGEKQGISFPYNDYSKYYLLESQGRKIKSLGFRKFSKYLWDYDVPMGIESFDDDFSPNTIYIYKIKKIEIKQNGD